MKPLIDCDILRYEIGAIGQYVDPDTGELVIRDFQFVSDQLDEKIRQICAEVWATEPPLLFLTNDRRLHKKVNRQRKKDGKEELEYIPNFRDEVAKNKVYKGNRVATEKPFHYDNLTAYIFANYDTQVAVGMEADDLLSVFQYQRILEGCYDTIICSRDKDLRITPGMHFGWECGRQRSFGPAKVEELGDIELVQASSAKIVGTGLKFFYSQVLTGDNTDNYGGLKGCGPVAAHKALVDCSSEGELFSTVLSMYEKKLGDTGREAMLEQARLAWMVRELEENGSPVMYQMYDERV